MSPDQLETLALPHALGPEKSVLSTFLQEPERLTESHGITEESFYLPAHQELFAMLPEMREHGKQVEIVSLAQALIDVGKLETIGGPAAITELYSYAPSAKHFAQHCRELHEKHAQRLLVLAGRAAAIGDEAEHARLIARREHVKAICTGTHSVIAQRAFNVSNPPPEPPPMVKLGHHGLFTAGNLSAIIADRKAGKSSAESAIMAAIMAPRNSQADFLGFSAYNPQGRAVVHFDTEQSPSDHHRLVVRALRRAGITEPPAWFSSYSLTGLSLADRIRFVDEVCKIESAKHDGLQMVFLDGIADLCRDPNDQAEAFDLVEKWHNFSVNHECVVLAILHLNPGTEKSRGHLGSQLERKVETPLVIKKDSKGISTMFATHARSCHIAENEGFSFTWCDDEQMHVSISQEDRTQAKTEAARGKASTEAHAILAGREPMTYSELCREIERHTAVSARTAKTRIKTWHEMGVIERHENGAFTLPE